MTTTSFAIGLACGVVASLLFTWDWVHQAAEMRRRGYRDARFEPHDILLVFVSGGAVFMLVQIISLVWEASQAGAAP